LPRIVPPIDESGALLAEKAGLAHLPIPDPLGGGRMHNMVNAIALYRERVQGERLIEGWTEGPAAEGADLRGINQLMLDFYDDPAFVRDLFEFTVEMELRFARAEIDAGADLIAIGDSAASLVGPRIYREFVLPFEKKLVDGIHACGVPVRLHICGNTRAILQEIGGLGCENCRRGLARVDGGRTIDDRCAAGPDRES
jgi:uroporphyrinogen-III decarboxylase